MLLSVSLMASRRCSQETYSSWFLSARRSARAQALLSVGAQRVWAAGPVTRGLRRRHWSNSSYRKSGFAPIFSMSGEIIPSFWESRAWSRCSSST